MIYFLCLLPYNWVLAYLMLKSNSLVKVIPAKECFHLSCSGWNYEEGIDQDSWVLSSSISYCTVLVHFRASPDTIC
ncbi:Hypothetical predicted protein [Olea europaea subsp. europaea]|uniref:Uncharacterized protein n=1 Tax=Olea europaea subsp. europaea TaxID=158383 RepID=A0A8S0UR28_OLEEU|nr:Hypothetical predicted protein [Olea europaea subsp. europaea]